MLNKLGYVLFSLFNFALTLSFMYFTARWLRVLFGLDDGIDPPSWFNKFFSLFKRRK